MAEETKVTEAVPAENKPEDVPEQPEKSYSEQEYNALKSQLDTAKNTVEDYKQKWEQSENDRKAFEHKTKIGGYVKSLGLRDDIYEKHVTDLILEKGLKFDGEKLIGGDDVLNDFKSKYPNAFKSAEPVPEFSVSTTGQTGTKDKMNILRTAAGLK